MSEEKQEQEEEWGEVGGPPEVEDDDVPPFAPMAPCPVCGGVIEIEPPCRYVKRWLAGELTTWGGRTLPPPPADEETLIRQQKAWWEAS